MDNIRFKIPGNGHLYTFDQLTQLPNATRLKSIKVIDVVSQRNWCANFKTIYKKFR